MSVVDENHTLRELSEMACVWLRFRVARHPTTTGDGQKNWTCRVSQNGSEAALFLDRNSPACFGSSGHCLLHPRLLAPFLDLSQVVRTGRTTLPEEGTISHDHPIWVE